MPQYKLTYFGVRARGETARCLFALAGQEYEDNRISLEQWPEFKPKTPMGLLPLLEVDGTTICQSNTINRFLAREFGFAGNSSLEQAQIDSVMESVEDSCEGMLQIFFATPEVKAAMQQKHTEQKLLPVLKNLERMLGSKQYFVGDKLTVADVHATCLLDATILAGGDSTLWDNYTGLKALHDRVCANKNIAAWMAKRPETPY